jgi:hypothetical protein
VLEDVMEEQKSFPVRYMVVSTWYGFKVIDTLSSKGVTVKRFIDWLSGMAVIDAHKFALMKNESEGYVYAPN